MFFYICFAPQNSYLSKKPVPTSTEYCDYQRGTDISSYMPYYIMQHNRLFSLRCTGGFIYSPHSNGKGVKMMLSREYRERIERRFTHFTKAVLHNEVCNYYRERKQKIQHEISFEYLQENTPLRRTAQMNIFVLQDKPTDFTANGQIVTVDSEKLARALLCLSEWRWEIILMRYYLQLRISRLRRYWESRTTVNYQEKYSLETVADRNGEDE